MILKLDSFSDYFDVVVLSTQHPETLIYLAVSQYFAEESKRFKTNYGRKPLIKETPSSTIHTP